MNPTKSTVVAVRAAAVAVSVFASAMPAWAGAPASAAYPVPQEISGTVDKGADTAGAAPTADTSSSERPVGASLGLEQLRTEMAAAEKRREEALKPDPAIDNKVLAEEWGVEVIGIQRAAGGYMLDFRFQVVDAKKALPLFDHRIKPYVVASKSDIKLPVPMAAKVGAFRPTNRGKNIKSDKTYYMLFANPDRYVKSGEKVSVVIGDFKAEHLTVQE